MTTRHYRRKHHPKMPIQHLNEHFGKLSYKGNIDVPTEIHLIQYSADLFFEQDVKNIGDVKSLMKPDCVNWIRVSGLNDSTLILNLVKEFGLNPFDARDILTPDHVIAVEEFDENIFVVLPAVYLQSDRQIVKEHISIILGTNYVITFQETQEPLFDVVSEAIKNNVVKIDNRRCDYLLASLLRIVLNNYEEYISIFEDKLEELEDELLDVDNFKKDTINDIQERRRELIALRKIMIPYKDQFLKFLRSDNGLIQKKTKPFFKDLYDQVLYILQSIESCREIMPTLVDLYMNNNDVKLNKVMSQLTVVATVFIPMTFLVGVWGMNFEFMPELRWKYGYFFAWGVMLLVAIICYFFMRKKGWFR